MDKIGATANLDNALSIKTFIAKFPIEVQWLYVSFKAQESIATKPMSEVLNLFIVEE